PPHDPALHRVGLCLRLRAVAQRIYRRLYDGGLHAGDDPDQDFQRPALRLHADHGGGLRAVRRRRGHGVRPCRPVRRPAQAARRLEQGRGAMKMAVCQMDAAAGDRAARLAMIESTTRDAKSHGAALVVFPELAVTGYGVGTEMISAAETRDGPIVALLSNVARIAHTFLV